MNKQLLRQLHEVRYRELSALIGQTITISSFSAILPEILALLAPYTVACGTLVQGFDNMRGSLAKYSLLDIEFSTSNPVLVPEDRVHRDTLTTLGFLSERDLFQRGDAAGGDRDPTCIKDLTERTQPGHEWVKVFLYVWPFRDACEEYMAALAKAQRTGAASHDAFVQLMVEVDGLFPCQFQVQDACIANSDFIWVHKHFYM